MKAVLIIHNVAIEQEVNEALKSVSIDCYTKFPNILGKGMASEPHLNTDVWPGINCGTFVVTGEAPAKELMEKVRLLREKWASVGIKAFMWEIEDII
jgi:hypothetical protein